MTSALTSTGASAESRAPGRPDAAGGTRRARAGGIASPDTTAIILATSGGAGLRWEDGSVLDRLVAQFADLEVSDIHVIARAGAYEPPARPGITLHRSAGLAEDLGLVAEIAASGSGPVAITQGDIVTHREAFAGLLADPRYKTAILATTVGHGRPFAARVRSQRGRLLAAASQFHNVRRGNASFLGVIKVAPMDRAALAAAAARAADVAADPPQAWREEIDARPDVWRWFIAEREAGRELTTPEEVSVSEEIEAEIARRAALAREDAASLLLVALVRGGTRVGLSFLRHFFWSRPTTAEAAEEAGREIRTYDEDRLLLDQAVKGSDGFFTTYFVSPYSRYIARGAARRGFTPNQITVFSLAVAIVAAAAFATGERWGLIAGAVLLQASFTFDCVDGQLARYTRTFSKLGAWLDSIFDRSKEYIVFAGLALGSAAMGDDVWILAGAALALQTTRHTLEFSYGAARHQALAELVHPPLEVPSDDPERPPPRRRRAGEPYEPPGGEVERPPKSLAGRFLGIWSALERVPGVLWVKKIIQFPIGERFAAISITAAIWDPRTTFTVYLAWAGFAALYTLAGRTLRSRRG